MNTRAEILDAIEDFNSGRMVGHRRLTRRSGTAAARAAADEH